MKKSQKWTCGCLGCTGCTGCLISLVLLLMAAVGAVLVINPELIPVIAASSLAAGAAGAVGGISHPGNFASLKADTNPGGPNSSSSNASVAVSAMRLASHLSGDHLQSYTETGDGVMQKAEAYWKVQCGGDSSCYQKLAQSGSLQCVEFVTAAFNQAGIPLPVAHDAYQFWSDYHNRPDWQEDAAKLPPTTDPTDESKAATGLPVPGDIVVYMNQVQGSAPGKYKLDDTGKTGPGHVSVVVVAIPPTGNTAGELFVAQANGPSNTNASEALSAIASKEGKPSGASSKPLEKIPLYKSSIDPGGWIDDGDYHDQVVVGYIHYIGKPVSVALNAAPSQGSAPSNPAGPQGPISPDEQSVMITLPHMVQPQWFPVAWTDAVNNGIPPAYYVKQIYEESSFNPDAVRNDPSTGAPIANGIAQFKPDIATANGVNPNDPTSALNGAAKLMRTTYCHYLGSGDCDQLIANSTQQARSGAYEKALVAYHADQTTVDNAVRNCGEANWFACLSSDEQTYVNDIANS